MANRFFPSYPGYKITSPYGMRTLNGTTKMHNGIDLVAKTASGGSAVDQIMAHTGGSVDAVGYDTTSGNYIRLKTGANTTMFYCHMKSKPDFQKGDSVKTGQVIGYMGSTGKSTGAHLHFGIKVSGKWIDPEPYLDKPYDEDSAVPATTAVKVNNIPLPTLKKGDKGETVKALQILLAGRGHKGNMHEPDGKFGPNTEGAVKSFQKANGLTADGIAGVKTWEKLLGVK